MTPMPQPPYSPDLTLSNLFFFPGMKKVLKGKPFASVEEVKQKIAEALEDIKIDKFKICFKQWKKISVGILHQMGRTLKVTEV